MALPTYSRCRLCSSERPLCLSHIFPKFYWEWLKSTGDVYFRDPNMPNRRLQDGFKLRMLCSECEGRFSQIETHFAERVFRPLVDAPQEAVRYESFALRFLISVLWRNLALDLDNSDSPSQWREELSGVEAGWRDYLLERWELSRYGRVHLIVTDLAIEGSPQCNNFLTRVAEATEIRTEDALIGYYAKFAKLVFVGELTGSTRPSG